MHWTIAYAGRALRLRHAKGVTYLATLLRGPGDALGRELARAVGLHGRIRKAGSTTERARINVSRAIGAVVRKITVVHPALGEHLAATIRTGTYCSYVPDPHLRVDWEL
jgi:hypothetical protein